MLKLLMISITRGKTADYDRTLYCRCNCVVYMVWCSYEFIKILTRSRTTRRIFLKEEAACSAPLLQKKMMYCKEIYKEFK